MDGVLDEDSVASLFASVGTGAFFFFCLNTFSFLPE